MFRRFGRLVAIAATALMIVGAAGLTASAQTLTPPAPQPCTTTTVQVAAPCCTATVSCTNSTATVNPAVLQSLIQQIQAKLCQNSATCPPVNSILACLQNGTCTLPTSCQG